MLTKTKAETQREVRTYALEHPSFVKSYLSNGIGGVFGIEMFLESNVKRMNFFTDQPDTIRSFTPANRVLLDLNKNNQECHYIIFSSASCFPFNFEQFNVWGLIEQYTKSVIQEGGKLFLQTMFKYNKDEKWKAVAYDQYNSYLEGVPFPTAPLPLRALQLKIVHKYEDYFSKPREIEQVTQKLEQDGFSTCIRFVIEGSKAQRKLLREKVLTALNTQRAFNSWEFASHGGMKSSFISDIHTRHFHRSFKNQILCPLEMNGFFGAEKIKNEISYKPVAKALEEQQPKLATSLKPVKKETLDEESLEIMRDLSVALKQMNIIKHGELKTVDIRKGVTINTISFECHPDLTYDKLRKRIEDIETRIGVKGISFDQGSVKGSMSLMYPTKDRKLVKLEEIINTKEFKQLREKYELPVVVGVDVAGNLLCYDLVELVHVLIAGATGMGKSVFLNVLLLCLTKLLSPNELELYLIDPKKIELAAYEDFPHVKKLITDPRKANVLLNGIVLEMEERYTELKKGRARDIQTYNKKYPDNKMPYKVVVIEEFADLMLVDNSVEDFVQRLGQLARAAGIHLIIATQRPSVDVITGVIKSNIMTRFGFTCESYHDYKTIFDYNIPYRLVGKGDGVMKWHKNDSQFVRFQSPFNDDESIFDQIVMKWGKRDRDEDELDEEYEDLNEEMDEEIEEVDEKYLLLKKVICETGETRNRQLREVTGLTPNEISDYLQQLVEEGWLEKSGNRFTLTLTQEQMDEYLGNL